MNRAMATWRGEASCQDRPTSAFFPRPGSQAFLDDAKAVCTCGPVQAYNQAQILADPETCGAQDGLSPAERDGVQDSAGTAA